MTARESPQPPLRSGAREAINSYREDARRHGRAAVPWVREDRVSHIARQHKTVKHWIMTSHRVRDHRGLEERGGFLVEPGEIGLAPLEEARDGIDQNAKGRLAQLAAGLAER